MKKDLKFYFKLFASTFYLSAFTFGGGFVMIPLMRKKFVDQYKWIDEKEMLDLTAIAQASPGAIAVNAAILVGYRLAGILGAMITTLGTVLPPLLILSFISLAYTEFRDSLIVKYVLRGMQAGVAAVVIDVVVTMGINLIKERKSLPIMVMLLSFAAAFFLHINVIFVILASGIIGGLAMYYSKHIKKSGEEK